jgi:transaldolase
VRDPQEVFLELGLEDIRRAAAILRPVHRSSGGADGLVSFECTPDLADAAEATVAQATMLWERLGLPNVMIKVPATDAGVTAIEQLTARGVNVNVTLLFSVDRYEQVIEAYLRLGAPRCARIADRVAAVGRIVLRLAGRCEGGCAARRRLSASWPRGHC